MKYKKYKLLKDLPTFKAGQLAYISKTGNLIAGTPENQETTETGLIIMIYHETTLKKFPNILTEWFEEIKEESTDSIHWKPKHGAEYFWIDECGSILPGTFYRDSLYDQQRLTFGNVYRTEKEAEKASERRLAEVRLRRTSTFKPDFKNNRGGYVIIDRNCIYKIELDKEFDMNNNFVEVAKTQDDTYEFITWFYNGGTDLGKMLQDGFDKIRQGN